MDAVVILNSWAGRIEHPCRVVGETPTKYRITVDKPTVLPRRILQPGKVALVPKKDRKSTRLNSSHT